MGAVGPPILILDASVLINFLAINRADLLGRCSVSIFVTDHVIAEVTKQYPKQAEALQGALASGCLQQTALTDVQEQATLAKFRAGSGRKQLGVGECSGIAVAIHRGFELAIDDQAAIKLVRKLEPNLAVRTTQNLVLRLISQGHLTVEQADAIKTEWESNHRFKLKLRSFGDLLAPRAKA